ncbi:hypothetical protein NH340_JMT04143 [Sarcoptes scabiei]|nr:hypothetical protein NH340_JMT04143 [Sarcoptes scabiei]
MDHDQSYQQESSSSNTDISILRAQTSKAIQYSIDYATTLLENHLNHKTVFDEKIKSELRDVLKNLLESKHQINLQEQIVSHMKDQDVESTLLLSENDDFEKSVSDIVENLYSNAVEQFQTGSNFNLDDNEDYKKLINLITDQENPPDETDEIEMLATEFSIPIDPISKVAIVFPLRNKRCNHHYDRESFMNLIQTQVNKTIKCPVTGCLNKIVTEKDVEEDVRLRIMIENARFN